MYDFRPNTNTSGKASPPHKLTTSPLSSTFKQQGIAGKIKIVGERSLFPYRIPEFLKCQKQPL